MCRYDQWSIPLKHEPRPCVDQRPLRVERWYAGRRISRNWYTGIVRRRIPPWFWCTTSLTTARDSTTVRKLSAYPRHWQRKISRNKCSLRNAVCTAFCTEDGAKFHKSLWLTKRYFSVEDDGASPLASTRVQLAFMTIATQRRNPSIWSVKTRPGLQVNGAFEATVRMSEGRKTKQNTKYWILMIRGLISECDSRVLAGLESWNKQINVFLAF